MRRMRLLILWLPMNPGLRPGCVHARTIVCLEPKWRHYELCACALQVGDGLRTVKGGLRHQVVPNDCASARRGSHAHDRRYRHQCPVLVIAAFRCRRDFGWRKDHCNPACQCCIACCIGVEARQKRWQWWRRLVRHAYTTAVYHVPYSRMCREWHTRRLSTPRFPISKSNPLYNSICNDVFLGSGVRGILGRGGLGSVRSRSQAGQPSTPQRPRGSHRTALQCLHTSPQAPHSSCAHGCASSFRDSTTQIQPTTLSSATIPARWIAKGYKGLVLGPVHLMSSPWPRHKVIRLVLLPACFPFFLTFELARATLNMPRRHHTPSVYRRSLM